MTLTDLHRMSAVIALHRVFISAGLDPSTMRARLRRGSPELTSAEAESIARVIADAGIKYVSIT